MHCTEMNLDNISSSDNSVTVYHTLRNYLLLPTLIHTIGTKVTKNLKNSKKAYMTKLRSLISVLRSSARSLPDGELKNFKLLACMIIYWLDDKG